MQIQTKAVHAGDRKKPGSHTPITTPIHTASSFFYDSMEQLDRIFGQEEQGYCYARYDNPSAAALEEVLTALEGGHGSLACGSGMAALQMAILTALADRRKSIVAANAMYGATVGLLMKVFEPMGVEVRFADICDLDGLRAVVADAKPGCLVIETISNPLLRVGALDQIAEIARDAGAALVVDNTFATPMIVRPLQLGAHFSVHSVTKYLAGHGDVLGGAVVSDAEHYDALRAYSRTIGPVLGPFECYLTMRGIKTFPLRMERQCANACRVAQWLAAHPRVERVYFTGDPAHPDAATIRRLFPQNLYGAMVSFELKDAARAEVFQFMDALKMVVRATSLGDVHTMMLYPTMSSHREISPKHRERMGIRDNLVRLSVGIEAVDLGALVVSPGPDYTLTITPSGQVTVPRGGSVTVLATVTGVNGFGGTVNLVPAQTGDIGCLHVIGMPAWLDTNTYPRQPITITNNCNDGTFGMTLTLGDRAISPTHSATVLISSGPLSEFSIKVGLPAPQMLGAQGSISYPLTLQSISGFAGCVSLGVSGYPSGVTPQFSPSQICLGANGSGASTLGLTSSASTPGGNYTINVTGSYGAMSRNALVVLGTQSTAFQVTVNGTPVSSTVSNNGIAVTANQGVPAGNAPVYSTCSTADPSVTCSVVSSGGGTVSLSVTAAPGAVHGTRELVLNGGTPVNPYVGDWGVRLDYIVPSHVAAGTQVWGATGYGSGFQLGTLYTLSVTDTAGNTYDDWTSPATGLGDYSILLDFHVPDGYRGRYTVDLNACSWMVGNPFGPGPGPLPTCESAGAGLEVTDPPPATITTISPVDGLPGDTVTLSGSEFGSNPKVNFGGTLISASGNNTQITFTIPVGSTAGSVQVTVRDSNSIGFEVRVPKYFSIVARVQSSPAKLNCDPGSVGFGTDITYQVLDSYSRVLQRANLLPEEHVEMSIGGGMQAGQFSPIRNARDH